MAEGDFKREQLAVDGLTLATGVLVVFGILAMFAAEPDTPLADAMFVICLIAFATLAGLSLWVSQAAAACAQILDDAPWARGTAWACAAFTGVVSMVGPHLAFAVLTDQPEQLPPMWAVDIAGALLAGVKPAMAFVIRACRSKAQREEQARADRQAETNRRLDLEAAARRGAGQEKPPHDNALEPSPAPARSGRRARPDQARRMAREMAGQQIEAATRRGAPAPVEQAGPVARDVSIEEIQAACRRIIAAAEPGGEAKEPSLRLVASNLNVPRSRIDKALMQANTKLHLVAAQARQAMAA